MSEKVSGIIHVLRSGFGFFRTYLENLIVTDSRIIVAKKSSMLSSTAGALWTVLEHIPKEGGNELSELQLEDILDADKSNFTIPNSEITRVDLWKKLGGIRIKITTRKKVPGIPKRLGWGGMGTIPKISPNKGYRIEDYENILRPIFGDKLSVKK